ncbi:MAG: exodeoxyribonuclease VII large subunit [Propionibacteriales bacterium]|nr:exodeoxyribonuclease VII large subunit [Propionibacteriales bacterium]
MALQTSVDKPAPVRVIANVMTGYIDRLGPIWVEGQVAQLSRRSSSGTVFLTLRDPVAEVSVQVTVARSIFDAMTTPVTEGARVVVFAKFNYYVPRGTLSLNAKEIRPVGVGELLARIEQRRQLLAAEGLFDPRRKRTLPFLPHQVGLVVGRSSAAERDVVDNARRRWPGVTIRIEYAAVQGHDAARQVVEALGVLDRDKAVDVIIVARGGGALEDLLPFSDEGLLRAVAACTTPVVSAIGHESDQPLLDLVADLRASTPTDAAKRVIPDIRDEISRIGALRARARYVVSSHVDREVAGLATARSRPVLAAPHRMFDQLSNAIDVARHHARGSLDHRLSRASDDLEHRLARVRSLSPLATLERGYAVVQTTTGDVVTDAALLTPGDNVVARLAAGRFTATVSSTTIADEGKQ